MTFLEYEKEILENTNSEACLVILAKGLGHMKVISTILQFYTNDECVVFLLNPNSYELKWLQSLNYPYFYDITGMHGGQRNELYRKGGVFYGSQTALVTDFVNGVIAIEKISAMIVLNAETVEQYSALAFICYLFREKNSLGLIKAISTDAIILNKKSLEIMARTLCLRKILFYPRFHEKIKEEFTELEVKQSYLKESEFMAEVTLLVEDILKKIHINDKQPAAGFSYIKTLIYKQKNKEAAKFKRLLSLLYSADSLTIYLFFLKMVDNQRKDSPETSWIFDESSHLLGDILKGMLVKDIEKSMQDPSNFIFDVESKSFRIEIALEEMKRIQCENEQEIENLELEYELSDDSNDSIAFIEDREVDNKEQDPRVLEEQKLLLEMFESKLLSNFYLINKKFKKIVDIIRADLIKKTVILVRNRTIRRVIKNSLKSISMNEQASVFTHTEFQKEEGLLYERIILANPELLSLRNIEYLYSGTEKPEIYILQYKNTIDEQIFLEEIREEKDAFEKMIDERAKLPLKLELDTIEMEDDNKYNIVVDSREMRSKLPFFLYRAGNTLEIKILEIGDYLLETGKCIERKAIEDFISSLSSGRLYLQAQKMTHNYRNPILLIEFPDGKPVLSDFDKIENFRNSYIAKFCLFLFNFPTIQVIWSNSHTSTVKIIRDIQNQDEEGKCTAEFDPELYEALMCIPGVNSFNCKRICREFSNLYDLATCELERLEKTLDPVSAEKVYNFFRQSL
ncbi:DNA repair protein RAD16 [Glugoides intestinalis]